MSELPGATVVVSHYYDAQTRLRHIRLRDYQGHEFLLKPAESEQGLILEREEIPPPDTRGEDE